MGIEFPPAAGPWSLLKTVDADGRAESPKRVLHVVDADGKVIAAVFPDMDVVDGGIRPRSNQSGRDATARLVMAAPDLLAAARAIVGLGGDPAKVGEMLVLAIAKAEGRYAVDPAEVMAKNFTVYVLDGWELNEAAVAVGVIQLTPEEFATLRQAASAADDKVENWTVGMPRQSGFCLQTLVDAFPQKIMQDPAIYQAVRDNPHRRVAIVEHKEPGPKPDPLLIKGPSDN